MTTMTSRAIIHKLQSVFVSYGFCNVTVTDNVSAFTCTDFEEFVRQKME